jgi:uncharacterized Ntn-hydrolase superfamily protein
MAEPVVATYSIVGCDLGSGEWGVAVQSKFLAVGAVVPFAEAGVGAVATQASANTRYGPDGLTLLRQGFSAQETVGHLVGADDGRDTRQVGAVDSRGGSASYTGSECLEWAGGRIGASYAAQGNILVSEATVDALADAYEAADGKSLAERLLDSLAAGQAAGGDSRGQQSAALLVVREGGGYAGLSDRLIDLRVDDHERPIEELRRLYELHQTFFGQTARWVTVDDALADELRERLARLGYEGDLADAFRTWAGVENLEERVDGVDRVDAVVLAALRAQT